jgi:hypothetical protein
VGWQKNAEKREMELRSHFLDSADAEWRTRPLKFWGVIKSVYGQLSSGQELTKVSLPAELCEPYSGLELSASRSLNSIPLLYRFDSVTSPKQKILQVLRW